MAPHHFEEGHRKIYAYWAYMDSLEDMEMLAAAAVMEVAAQLEGSRAQGQAPPVRSSSSGPTGIAPTIGRPQTS